MKPLFQTNDVDDLIVIKTSLELFLSNLFISKEGLTGLISKPEYSDISPGKLKEDLERTEVAIKITQNNINKIDKILTRLGSDKPNKPPKPNWKKDIT